jgi:hypothetical protein
MPRDSLGRVVRAARRLVARVGRAEQGGSLPLVDDPVEALFECQGGRETAFLCPIERCTHFIGFGFSPADWHPFVATLLEYREGSASRFEDSVLRAYYDVWRPGSAAEAVAGLEPGPLGLRDLPPHCFYLTPWTAWTAERVTEDTLYWSAQENEEHGDPGLDFRTHGLGYFGPTHPRKGRMEFRRLTTIHDLIASRGYDRTHGDVVVRVLERGHEWRYLVDGGGYHRTAAVAAVGHETVPARFRAPFTIRVEDAEHWPQVRRGVWRLDEAVRYFHHLFDFDGRSWARERGLLPEQRRCAGTETP